MFRSKKILYSLLSQLEIDTAPVLIKSSEIKLVARILGKLCLPPPFFLPEMKYDVGIRTVLCDFYRT